MREWLVSSAQVAGGEVKVKPARETTLQDGVTEAVEFTSDVSVLGFPVKTVTLFVPRGPQTVMVAVAWMDVVGLRASQKVDEIIDSLYFE